MQLQPDPFFKVVITKDEIISSWNWLISHLTNRPLTNQPDHCCIYDKKLWGFVGVFNPLLINDKIAITHIARLYITSQLMGNMSDLIPLSQDDFNDDIGINSDRLEDSVKKLIKSNKRFRHALSENLAFWAQFAHATQSGIYDSFSLTPPNFLPEEKGLDGLMFAVRNDSRPIIELRSVKSSIRNPRNMVASNGFRQNGNNPIANKQLEEFSLIAQGKFGFIRLDRLISNACHELRLPANRKIRSSLLINNKSFNAMVVADDQYADYELFSSYNFVSSNPIECVATYIGSENWLQISEIIRVEVLHIFRQTRVW